MEAALLELARTILAQVEAGDPCGDAERIDGQAVKAAADLLIARYRREVPAFKAEACLREDTAPGLMVSGGSLLVSTDTRMSRGRLDALLQHEVSVHLLTFVNGSQQGLGIFGAGLDVTEPEPIPMDSPLLTLDNIVIVPHIASASKAAREKMSRMAAENLIAGLKGERLPNCVNPQVYL